MADRIGQHIDDYRLSRLLGRGSFGEVYLGEHLHDQTLVAMKILSLSQENWKEFVKEASTTFRLKHPHIIHLLTFGMSADNTPYLIMDYAPNGTLRQRHPKGTRLSLATVISYLLPLASALQYAHDSRVIHCDVKPQNVLIGQNGEVLLSDFGIAVIVPIEQPLTTQNLVGTAPYMAPEQIRGKPQAASDQYALGIMAYEWLCGVRPFQGTMWELLDQHRYLQPPPLCEKLPDLPPMVEEIILKALAKDPQERFTRVQDFAAALQQVIQAGKPSPTLSSLGLPLTLSSMDVSSQPKHAPTSQPKQTPSKLPSREGLADMRQHLIGTNPAVSPPTVVSPMAPTFYPLPSPSINYPHTPQTVFAPSIPPTVRSGPTRRQLILFIGLLLIVLGGSVFFSPAVINSLARFSPFTIGPTLAPPFITATAAADAYAAGTTKNGIMFGFDAAHTNWNPYEKVLNKTNVPHLQQDWSYGISINAFPPIVANGIVYIGSGDNKLYAFDATCRHACQPLWSYATNDSITSSPAIAGNVIYIGSRDGRLYAFDATCHHACQPLWSYAANIGYSALGISSQPIVANGIVYIGSGDNRLYAFDATCRHACQPLWSYDTGGSFTSPAVANGLVYVDAIYSGTSSYYVSTSRFYAFNATCRHACQPLWSYEVGSNLYTSPAVANGLVYVFGNKLYAFDATCRHACQPLWSYARGGGNPSSPVVANGVVYDVSSDDGKLYAFEATCHSACQLLWSYDTGGYLPAVANGVLYVGCNDKLCAFGVTRT